MYEHLISPLEEEYDEAVKQLHAGKLREKLFDTLIFVCDGKPLRTIRGESIDPDNQVLVAYADLGG